MHVLDSLEKIFDIAGRYLMKNDCNKNRDEVDRLETERDPEGDL